MPAPATLSFCKLQKKKYLMGFVQVFLTVSNQLKTNSTMSPSSSVSCAFAFLILPAVLACSFADGPDSDGPIASKSSYFQISTCLTRLSKLVCIARDARKAGTPSSIASVAPLRDLGASVCDSDSTGAIRAYGNADRYLPTL